MNTPPKLTPEQIDDIDQGMCGERECAQPFARAIEAARDFQWIEMLSARVPVIWLYEGIEYHVRGKLIAHREQQKRFETRWWKEVGPLYTHPHPDDTMYLLRRLLSNQHTLTGPEFRQELAKIVDSAALDSP